MKCLKVSSDAGSKMSCGHLRFRLIISNAHFIECGKSTSDPILTQFVLKDSAKMPIKYKSVKALQRIS